MTEEAADTIAERDLRDRVRRIEAAPLETRTAEFLAVHDELLAELERSDRPNGAAQHA